MKIQQEHFEAWLFSQPDEMTYDYSDNTGCLLCDFVKKNTNKRISVAGYAFRLLDDPTNTYIKFEGWLKEFMCGKCVMVDGDYTTIPLSNTYKIAKAIYIARFGAVNQNNIIIESEVAIETYS